MLFGMLMVQDGSVWSMRMTQKLELKSGFSVRTVGLYQRSLKIFPNMKIKDKEYYERYEIG